jgi:hypothetical protein
LKHAGIKTWSEFNRSASYWGIGKEDGIFRIIAHQEHTRKGWEEDPENSQTFPAGSSVEEVIDRMTAILQAISAQKRK